MERLLPEKNITIIIIIKRRCCSCNKKMYYLTNANCYPLPQRLRKVCKKTNEYCRYQQTSLQVKRRQCVEILNCSHFCRTLGESVSAQSQLVAAVATDPIHSIYFTFITNWQNCRCRDYLHPNFPFCPVVRKSMTHHKAGKIFSTGQVFIWK